MTNTPDTFLDRMDDPGFRPNREVAEALQLRLVRSHRAAMDGLVAKCECNGIDPFDPKNKKLHATASFPVSPLGIELMLDGFSLSEHFDIDTELVDGDRPEIAKAARDLVHLYLLCRFVGLVLDADTQVPGRSVVVFGAIKYDIDPGGDIDPASYQCGGVKNDWEVVPFVVARKLPCVGGNGTVIDVCPSIMQAHTSEQHREVVTWPKFAFGGVKMGSWHDGTTFLAEPYLTSHWVRQLATHEGLLGYESDFIEKRIGPMYQKHRTEAQE